MKTILIENVSRRSFLAGAAATGGLALAAQFVPFGALADFPVGRTRTFLQKRL